MTLPPAGGQPIRFDLDRPSPAAYTAIHGVVVPRSPASTRIGNVHIDARHADGTETQAYIGNWEDPLFFELENLQPGPWTLTFSADTASPTTMTVPRPVDDLVVELADQARPRVVGTVVDPDTGEPVQDYALRTRWVRPLEGGPTGRSDRQWRQ